MRERKVRDHAERLARPRELERIGVRDLHAPAEPRPQAACIRRVQLDGDDATGAVRELARYGARARTDLDDEVAAGYPGVADEISGETRSEEVPAAWAWTDALLVHGRPPLPLESLPSERKSVADGFDNPREEARVLEMRKA